MTGAATPRQRPRTWPDVLIAMALGAIALVVYNATLTPSLSYKSPDGNELATIPYILGLAHMTGYPLYTWLGKLFTYIPIGDVAHRVNLMSAVLGAGGVAFLYGIMREITTLGKAEHVAPSRIGSAFTALLFAFSRAFWSQTGIAEVYAPNVFMVTLTLWLLLKWATAKEAQKRGAVWWLLAFALSFGLGMGTHMSNLGFAPGFALFILLVDWRFLSRPLEFLGTASAFFLGLLQFAWLPYKAHTLTDKPMMRHAPRDLHGIFKYTLGAFPQFKFAFRLVDIPRRIVLYLYLLKQQFAVGGILLGLYGMVELLIRRPKRFFLLVAMYLVQVFFFVQYRAFDLDVFFITAHLIYALFIGYGVYRIVAYLWAFVTGRRGAWRWLAGAAAGLVLTLFLAVPIVRELRFNWEFNDYSKDVAINDFYDNVWEMLPENSAIVGRGGVFGYDMFYYRLVYNVRPDVLMPHLGTPTPGPRSLAGRDVFSTVRLDSPLATKGPWALPPGLLSPDSWYVPVLFGQGAAPGLTRGRELTLYHVTSDPPELLVPQARPHHLSAERLGELELVGYDLKDDSVAPGGRLHLCLYWRVVGSLEGRLPLVATSLGETPLESHELGLRNLVRYVREVRPDKTGIIVEDYAVTVPSMLEAGAYPLQVYLPDPFHFRFEQGPQGQVLELITIEVE